MLIRIPSAQLKSERSDDGHPLALQQREPVGPASLLASPEIDKFMRLSIIEL